jgi:probable HAF family extracellular repeat protein
MTLAHSSQRAPRQSRQVRLSGPEPLETRGLLSGYTITSLGTFGGPASWASGINNVGEVVGAADTRRYYWVFDGPKDKAYYADAFLWKPSVSNGTKGSMTDVDALGGIESEATSVNDTGQMVGRTDLPDGTHAFLWTPLTPGGTSGITTDLGGVGGPTTYAVAINGTGEVVGMSTGHAFLWKPTAPNAATGTLTDLTSTAGLTGVRAIDDSGQVLGTYQAADGTTHTCLWEPATPGGTTGSVIGLGDAPGSCMNDEGEIAGLIGSHLGLYVNGHTYDLGTLYTGITRVDAISSTGQIVGSTHLSSGADHAFLWTPNSPNGTTGTLADLNLLTGSNSVTLQGAYGINALGQIVGSGTINTGLGQALLLTPNTTKTQARPTSSMSASPSFAPISLTSGVQALPAVGTPVTASGSTWQSEDQPASAGSQRPSPIAPGQLWDLARANLTGRPRPRTLVNDVSVRPKLGSSPIL